MKLYCYIFYEIFCFRPFPNSKSVTFTDMQYGNIGAYFHFVLVSARALKL